MLQADILRPDALTQDDVRAWRDMLATTPEFASPLMGPAFARLVGEVRADAHVAVFRRGGETVGFLAHHRRPGGLGRPAGAPWSDRHALVTGPSPGFGWREALAAARLRAFRFTALTDPHGVFGGAVLDGADPAYAVAPVDAGEAYWERLRAGSPKRFKNIRRLEHKLDREEGPLELTFGDTSADALDLLIRWKREQFRRTGLHDVLHPEWSRAMMSALHRRAEPDFRGLLVTLRARGRVIAAHFGAQAGAVYHPWLAAYDPDWAHASPGLVFLSMAVRAMPEAGLERYELSGGSAHYKTVFADHEEELAHGSAEVRAPAASPGASRRPELLARVQRRLDHIAQAEPTLAGRIQGVALALTDMKKRLPSGGRAPASEA